MKPLIKCLRIMAVFPATALIALSVAAPSLAADNSCKTVIVTIGVGCSQPSSSPSSSPSSAPAPSPSETKAAPPPAQPSEPAPAPAAPPPVIAPQPQITIIIKETPAAPAPLPTITPSSVLPAEVMTPAPVLRAPDPTQTPTPAPPIDGEQASAHNAFPDFMKQAGEAAPYVFFIGLAGLISMLMVARSKKLFPFEDRTQRSGNTPSK